MTMDEYRTNLETLATSYTTELLKESPDAKVLTSLETQMKKVKSNAMADRAAEIIADAKTFTNPVVEAARNASFTYPTYKMVHENGTITGVDVEDATGQLKITDLTKELYKYGEQKDCQFEKTGCIKTGRAWEFAAEKAAFLMAQKVAGGLEIPDEAAKKLENFFKMKVEAKKVDLGKDPFSNRQMVKTIQSIIDKLVFVPAETGENAIKVTTKDVKYLTEVFTQGNRRTIGDVKTLKGLNMKQYIFNIVTMIVTGKSYSVNGIGADKLVRTPIPESAKIDAPKAEDEVVVERPAQAEEAAA